LDVRTAVDKNSEQTTSTVQEQSTGQIDVSYAALTSFTFAIIALLTSVILPLFLQTSSSMPHDEKQSNHRKIPLHRIWSVSQILFSASMFCTPLGRKTPVVASILVSSVGFSWSVTALVPNTILNMELTLRPRTSADKVEDAEHERNLESEGDSQSDDDLMNCGLDVDSGAAESLLKSRMRSVKTVGTASDVGLMLGLQNIAISLPQILSLMATSLISKLQELEEGHDGPAGWILQSVGVISLIAAYIAWKLGE
jgi:solute carrier family 45, member 1/2/4